MTVREFVLNTIGAIVVLAAIAAFWILLVAFGPGPAA